MVQSIAQRLHDSGGFKGTRGLVPPSAPKYNKSVVKKIYQFQQ